MLANKSKTQKGIFGNGQIAWKKIWPLLIIFAYITIIIISRISYVLTATANVPIMDYWRYIVQFVEKLFQEGITFADLWIPQEGATHRAIGVPIICFLLNVKYFALDTQIEIVAGVFATAVNCLFLLWAFLKKMKWENNIAKCGFVLIVSCMYNINQWEIMTLEFSLGFAVRQLLILIALFIYDELQKGNQKSYKLIAYVFFMCCVACLTGSYGPAVLGAMFFVFLIQFFVVKENKGRICVQSGMMMLAFAIVSFLFFCGIGGGISQNSGTNLIDMIFDGRIFKAVFIMLGSSVLHNASSVVAESMNNVLCIGVVLFVLYIIAIFIFFKRKMYEITYVPIMLMAYTAGSILVIAFGRLQEFDLSYLVASRYVCETTLGLVGIVWIFIYEVYCILYVNRKNKEKGILPIFKMLVYIIGTGFIMVNLQISYNIEMTTAPYRRIYYENLIEKMISAETITDEDASKFQSSKVFVEEGIEIMKKYKLGVFGE